ncbi:MAG: hypothetical protein FJ096_10975 [Deltaproteobacteria bacterium]|nr:hypothetical protein [Deltaproteobacteria bacterium]
MARPLARWFVLVTALAALAGCGAPQVSLARTPREYVATDYPSVLDRWTRTESLFLFDELTRALSVTATFEAWDFRWAYVIRYAQDYRLTIPQREALLRERLAATDEHHEFYLALYGEEDRQNDLTRPDSAWIVRLFDSSGSEIAPSSIEAVTRPGVLEQRFYPYSTVWRRAFRVRFPTKQPDGRPTIAPTAAWLGLRFAGPWGNTDLTWRLTADR